MAGPRIAAVLPAASERPVLAVEPTQGTHDHARVQPADHAESRLPRSTATAGSWILSRMSRISLALQGPRVQRNNVPSMIDYE